MESKINELQEKIAELQKEIEQLAKQESKYFDLSANANWKLGQKWDFFSLSCDGIQIRNKGEFKNKGFYLHEGGFINWEIIRDSEGSLVLLPTKKI